ncbi:MAG: hypothetical protein NTY38_12865 [Acidobacteria bacterium]|nr:hypothetical protein [Acidobacteriota bacterium]
MRTGTRAAVVWLVLMAVEVVHGTARTLLLAPRIGDFPARRLSVFTGSALILWMVWLWTPWLAAPQRRTQWRIGLAWVVATVVFELALGLAVGRSLESAAADFNLLRGGLMPLGLAVLAGSPWIAARIRRRKDEPGR